jgi:copper chaperone CopZ
MSKSCCSHQHAAAPIKAVSKAATPQAGHSHTSHCCDNGAQASGVANPTRHDHQGQSGADGPGDEEPPRGACATDTAHDHDHDHHEQGHAHTAAATEPPLATPEQNSRRHSWQVLGMDCPSCARKIETAVSRVEGVQQARVLFATEKLVVDLAPGLSPDPVTAAVLAAGFQLKGGAQNTARSEPGRSPQMQRVNNLLTKYWQPLSLAGLMGMAALLPNQLGQPLFTLATLWGLWPISRKAWALTKSGSPFAIETLMTVAAVGALFLGETAEAAMVLLLFMLGEHLEAYAAGRARAGVTALMALVPDKALRIRTTAEGEVREEVAADQLRPGDIIEIAPGARLAADARLLDPLGAFDESALTGESIPVERRRGDKVPAGSLAADRVLRLEVVSEPGNNAIDRILHLIEEAETQRAPIERFIDRFSRWYTPAMMLVALLVVLVPPLAFGQIWDEWVYRGLALLLIGCPCALVISTPAAVTSALAAATRQGALIKGGAALGRLLSLDFPAQEVVALHGIHALHRVVELHEALHLTQALRRADPRVVLLVREPATPHVELHRRREVVDRVAQPSREVDEGRSLGICDAKIHERVPQPVVVHVEPQHVDALLVRLRDLIVRGPRLAPLGFLPHLDVLTQRLREERARLFRRLRTLHLQPVVQNARRADHEVGTSCDVREPEDVAQLVFVRAVDARVSLAAECAVSDGTLQVFDRPEPRAELELGHDAAHHVVVEVREDAFERRIVRGLHVEVVLDDRLDALAHIGRSLAQSSACVGESDRRAPLSVVQLLAHQVFSSRIHTNAS